MNYGHIGRACGREVFVTPGSNAENDATQPQGYSIAAVVLKDGWKSDELGSLLNQLYGALTDWTPFDPAGGARSFVFYGERAEEASDLCDAFAYAWTQGAEQAYDDVMAASNDAADVENFVEAMFVGEIAISDTYASSLQNLVFGVLDEPDADGRFALLERVRDAVEASAQQHRFD